MNQEEEKLSPTDPRVVARVAERIRTMPSEVLDALFRYRSPDAEPGPHISRFEYPQPQKPRRSRKRSAAPSTPIR